jgi:hypothetical protein
MTENITSTCDVYDYTDKQISTLIKVIMLFNVEDLYKYIDALEHLRRLEKMDYPWDGNPQTQKDGAKKLTDEYLKKGGSVEILEKVIRATK